MIHVAIRWKLNLDEVRTLRTPIARNNVERLGGKKSFAREEDSPIAVDPVFNGLQFIVVPETLRSL